MIKYGKFKQLFDLSEQFENEDEFADNEKNSDILNSVDMQDVRPGKTTDDRRKKWLLKTIWLMSHTPKEIVFQNIPLNNEEKTKYFGMDLRTIKGLMYRATDKRSHQTFFMFYILLADFLWDNMKPLVTEKMTVSEMHKMQKEYKKEQNI